MWGGDGREGRGEKGWKMIATSLSLDLWGHSIQGTHQETRVQAVTWQNHQCLDLRLPLLRSCEKYSMIDHIQLEVFCYGGSRYPWFVSRLYTSLSVCLPRMPPAPSSTCLHPVISTLTSFNQVAIQFTNQQSRFTFERLCLVDLEVPVMLSEASKLCLETARDRPDAESITITAKSHWEKN